MKQLHNIFEYDGMLNCCKRKDHLLPNVNRSLLRISLMLLRERDVRKVIIYHEMIFIEQPLNSVNCIGIIKHS